MHFTSFRTHTHELFGLQPYYFHDITVSVSCISFEVDMNTNEKSSCLPTWADIKRACPWHSIAVYPWMTLNKSNENEKKNHRPPPCSTAKECCMLLIGQVWFMRGINTHYDASRKNDLFSLPSVRIRISTGHDYYRYFCSFQLNRRRNWWILAVTIFDLAQAHEDYQRTTYIGWNVVSYHSLVDGY